MVEKGSSLYGLRGTQQREGRDGNWGKKEVEEHGLMAEREVD